MLQLAHNIHKLGTESAFEVLARAEELSQQGRNIINLGIGQPDFRTPNHIVEAAIKALHDGHHGYTPAPGILPLREAVTEELFNTRGVEVNPDHLVCVPGGKVTMFFSILMFGEPGAEIMYPNPGFPIYESVINYSGADAVPIPQNESNDFSFDAEELLSLISPRTRLIILNTPNNPTGGSVTRLELEKLAAGLDNHPNIAILSDEIYSKITYDSQEHISLLEFENLRDRLILLDGWSKSYAMTGWRLGYALWPEKLVEHAKRLAINCHSCVNSATQFAGIAALKGPQDSVSSMENAFNERRSVIVDGLISIPGFSCRMPKGAFYAFPNISQTGLKANEMQDILLEKAGVATVAGTSFGKMGEGYIRFSYANSVDNIRKALDKVSGTLI